MSSEKRAQDAIQAAGHVEDKKSCLCGRWTGPGVDYLGGLPQQI